jgi:hypothetical protein
MTASPLATLASAHLRVARPTDRLEEVVAFYKSVLGFAEMGRFEDHDGFDGVMLGHPGLGYHLEFTYARGHRAGSAPTQDNLLVFYVPDLHQWQTVIQSIEDQDVLPVTSFNPYWDHHGRTYEDPDGYRVVIQNAAWES